MMETIRVIGVDVLLDDQGEGRGKIIVSDNDGHNYSMFWGAMGCSLKEFITKINDDYFCDKLLGSRSMRAFDAKGTISALRTHIRVELNLPWYRFMEFQKHLREELNNFQERLAEVNSDHYFVGTFDSFINRLDYSLIEDPYDRKHTEELFRGISEPWYFIVTKDSEECSWLRKLHGKLKKALI